MPFEVGNNNDTLISNHKVGETLSRAVKNIVNHIGVDKVDGGSSLMNWTKNTHNKKIRAQKEDHDTRILILLLFQTLIQI